MQRIFVVPHERHQALEIQHEIDALVEDSERREGALKLEREPTRVRIALGRALTQLDEPQHFARKHVADAGDRAAGAAIDEAVEHFSVDADHERDVVPAPGNVLGVFDTGPLVPDTDKKGFFNLDKLGAKRVQLPSERTGTFMVFKTFDNISYGLIMEATNLIRVGDKIQNP